jgi:hypothetical protein
LNLSEAQPWHDSTELAEVRQGERSTELTPKSPTIQKTKCFWVDAPFPDPQLPFLGSSLFTPFSKEFINHAFAWFLELLEKCLNLFCCLQYGRHADPIPFSNNQELITLSNSEALANLGRYYNSATRCNANPDGLVMAQII